MFARSIARGWPIVLALFAEETLGFRGRRVCRNAKLDGLRVRRALGHELAVVSEKMHMSRAYPAKVGNERVMAEHPISPVETLKRSFAGFNADKVPRLSAAMAYSALFAIAPLVIIAVEGASIVLGGGNAAGHHAQSRDAVFSEIGKLAGPSTVKVLEQIVDGTLKERKAGFIASIVSWIVLLFAAMGLFSSVQDSLNTVWGVEAPKSGGWKTTIRDRAATFVMIVVVAAVLLVSVLANAAIAALAHPLERSIPYFGAIAQVVDLVLTTGVVFVLFAAVFKFLPDAKIEWAHVRTGAAISAVLFVAGQLALSWYLGRAGIGSAYGAAGSLVVLLLWLNYSSQIFLFGAEYTKVVADSRGAHLGTVRGSEPNAAAVPAQTPATA